MKKIDHCLGSIEKWVGVILIFAMALCIFLQIVFRLTGVQVSWTEEMARYMFVCVTYYGSIYAFRKHKHLKVEVLESFTGKTGKFVFRLITNISSIIFCVFLTVLFVDYMEFLSKTQQLSAVMHIDLRIVYLAPLILGVLGLYELIKDTIIVLKTKEV